MKPHLTSKKIFSTLVVAFSLASYPVMFLTGCAVMSGRETAGEYIDDTTLTTKVKAAIFQDAELKTLQIHVETFQGNVQLSGFVDSARDRAKAYGVAHAIKGVRSVQNNILVRRASA